MSAGLSHLASLTAGIEKQKLPGAGWFKAGTGLRSNDPSNPGALALGTERLLQGRNLGDGTQRGMLAS